MSVEKLSAYQKNKLYRIARALKADIKCSMCTKDEMMHPTDDNVRKFMATEMKRNKDIRMFKDCMKAQGAGFKEYDLEKIRRGKITRR